MSDTLDSWLDAWGEWLDGLLATGLNSPSQETRGRIQAWCLDAELLGFAAQSVLANRVLDGTLTVLQRHQAFLDLLLEQDMLVRLHAANRLLLRSETADTAADEVHSE